MEHGCHADASDCAATVHALGCTATPPDRMGAPPQTAQLWNASLPCVLRQRCAHCLPIHTPSPPPLSASVHLARKVISDVHSCCHGRELRCVPSFTHPDWADQASRDLLCVTCASLWGAHVVCLKLCSDQPSCEGNPMGPPPGQRKHQKRCGTSVESVRSNPKLCLHSAAGMQLTSRGLPQRLSRRMARCCTPSPSLSCRYDWPGSGLWNVTATVHSNRLLLDMLCLARVLTAPSFV